MPSRRPQLPGDVMPPQSQRRSRRPQVPQSSHSLVPHDHQQQRPRRANNQLVPAPQQQSRRAPNAMVPHKPRPKRQPNAMVPYEDPEPSYRDEYDPPPERPFMAQFCEPRCFLLLLLILFFGLLLLIACILLIMSIDKGDPDGLAGWNYPIPARDPNGYPNSQAGDKFGTSLSAAGEFLAISAPDRENPNDSKGAIFLYVWIGNSWAIFGSDGILIPPDLDYEPKTWVDFQAPGKQSPEEKQANRTNFNNDSQNAVKWSDDGRRVMIGIPDKNSVVVYEFTHPVKESDYIASITVDGPYEEAGRNIAVSKDANRIALTAKYNATKDAELNNVTEDRGLRYLDDETNSTDTNSTDTNSTNTTQLPGVVHVYDYDETTSSWEIIGDPIEPPNNETDLGWGDNMVMSLDGRTVAISNPSYDGDVGYVDVFRLNNKTNVWKEIGHIQGLIPGAKFGFSMSISTDGSILAIGSPFYDAGRVMVYEYFYGSFQSGGQTIEKFEWEQKGMTFTGDNAGDQFGYSVALSEDGNSIVIGAPKAYNGVGKMVVFDYALRKWNPYINLPQKDQYGNYQASGNYGASVAMTNFGDSIFIGAPNHKPNDELFDYVEFFDKAPKGMQLMGRKRPDFVLAEHPDDDEFGR